MAESSSSVSPDVKLKRFLYTSTEHPHFTAGNVEHYGCYSLDNLTCVSEYIKSQNPETLLNIIEIVHSENLLPRREALFFVLAVAAASVTTPALKMRAYRTVSTLIQNSKDLFMFVKYYTKQNKKFPTGLNRLITLFYNNRDPLEFLEDVILCNRFHSWSHKDVLKLAHFKWEGLATAVIAVYILFGLKMAILVSSGDESVSHILDQLRKLENIKQSEDENRVIELIPELHCSLQRVPSIFHHSLAVWEALLPELLLRDIITYLPRMHTKGFLKSSVFQNKLIELITNIDKIQRSKIHPVEVFIGLKNFEKGGKPLDPFFKKHMILLAKEFPEKAKKKEVIREPIKCPPVVSALHKAMQISFQNLTSWGRKIMITIEVTKKMELPCISNKNISCLEAATILTLSMLRVERDVTVATFNDNRISIVRIEKSATFNQALTKIKEALGQSTYCSPSSPFNWATNKKKSIDVFINLLYYHHWIRLIPKELRAKEKPLINLNTYRKKMALPHAKLINFALGSRNLEIADGSPNILDISGFDQNVPTVIEAFSKGLF